MEISNNYSTAKVWNTSNKNVSKSSKKNKWKLTDSLKEKIVDLAKKDAQDNVYMGNAFMNLRKTEVSKVAPNIAALIGKFSQSMNSGNIFAFAPIENENRTLDQEEQKKFRKQALIILVLADMAIIISHKIHIEVCQWLLNGMIVAALLNLCGKIQTKCRAYKN